MVNLENMQLFLTKEKFYVDHFKALLKILRFFSSKSSDFFLQNPQQVKLKCFLRVLWGGENIGESSANQRKSRKNKQKVNKYNKVIFSIGHPGKVSVFQTSSNQQRLLTIIYLLCQIALLNTWWSLVS